MLLKNALDLMTRIEDYRINMNDLVNRKGLSDPAVGMVSQELDKEIIKLKKITKLPLKSATPETVWSLFY